MKSVASLMDRVLTHLGDAAMPAAVASEVEHLCLEFPLYPALRI
jgi:glycine/serine hydroxymethyltransferase